MSSHEADRGTLDGWRYSFFSELFQFGLGASDEIFPPAIAFAGAREPAIHGTHHAALRQMSDAARKMRRQSDRNHRPGTVTRPPLPCHAPILGCNGELIFFWR